MRATYVERNGRLVPKIERGISREEADSIRISVGERDSLSTVHVMASLEDVVKQARISGIEECAVYLHKLAEELYEEGKDGAGTAIEMATLKMEEHCGVEQNE